jgi:Bifunctional DNA primase/polymerase, N-terminal
MPKQQSGRGLLPGRSTQQHRHPDDAPIVADQHDSVAWNDPRDAALEYAARGWPVFPCAARGKTPLTAHGLKDASTHREHVWQWWQRWPHANVAVATGPVSGLLVVDLDGPGGRQSWERLTGEHGRMSTLVSLTGGGGVHALFAYPHGVELGNSAGRLGPGIDTRGAGGYVVVPPSVHACGRPYRWLASCRVHQSVHAAQGAFWRQPAPIPAWLLELLAPPPRSTPTIRPPVRATGGGGELADWMARQPQGRRNHSLFWAACRALERGYADDGLEQLLRAAVLAGLPEREARRAIASARTRVHGRAS